MCPWLLKCKISLPVDLSIEAQEFKVHPATEEKVYNDVFFSRQDVVVNALDNVEARRYVDRSGLTLPCFSPLPHTMCINCLLEANGNEIERHTR